MAVLSRMHRNLGKSREMISKILRFSECRDMKDSMRIVGVGVGRMKVERHCKGDGNRMDAH